MDRLTKGKDDKAAYAPSQPLFDALRQGCEDVEKQAKQLAQARDAIKNAHIAVNPVLFGDACGEIIAHWLKTLQVHQSIFEEVVNITSTYPSIDYDSINKGFASLVTAVGESSKAAQAVRTHVEKKRARSFEEGWHHNGHTTEDPSSSEIPNVAQRTSKKAKIEKGGDAVSLPIHSSPLQNVKTNPKVSVKQEDSDAPSIISTRKIKKARSQKSRNAPVPEEAPELTDAAENVATHAENDVKMGSDSGPVPPSTMHIITDDDMPPSMNKWRKGSYEDISNEVDALLAAKQEKRRLKKESKKRKRDSIASSIFSASGAENGPIPHSGPTTLGKAKKGKLASKGKAEEDQPPKKKAKVEAKSDLKNAHKHSNLIETKKSKKDIPLGASKYSAAEPVSTPSAKHHLGHVTPATAPPATGLGDTEATSDKKQKKHDKKNKRRHSSESATAPAHTQTPVHDGGGRRAKRVKTG